MNEYIKIYMFVYMWANTIEIQKLPTNWPHCFRIYYTQMHNTKREYRTNRKNMINYMKLTYLLSKIIGT